MNVGSPEAEEGGRLGGVSVRLVAAAEVAAEAAAAVAGGLAAAPSGWRVSMAANAGWALHEALADADVVVLMADPRRGLTTSLRRLLLEAHIAGARSLVVAADCREDGGDAQAGFYSFASAVAGFAAPLAFAVLEIVPVASATGANVVALSDGLAWHRGDTLAQAAELVAVRAKPSATRLVVRSAVAGAAGRAGVGVDVLAGRVAAGDALVLLPKAVPARVIGVERTGGASLMLDLEISEFPSAGAVLARPEGRPESTDQLAVHIAWLGSAPLLKGRNYAVELAGQRGTATISALKHVINEENLDHMAARRLETGQIGAVTLALDRPVIFDPAMASRRTGWIVLHDSETGEGVGYGWIDFALRRATNIHWQALAVDKAARAEIKGQRPVCLWFTGLSGSGKSTVASLLEKRLHADRRHTYTLDGDNVRHGLNRDLGFTDADRVENIRRIAEVAKLLVDAGLIVMVSFISPFRAERRMARELFSAGEFLEIFVDTPLEICERRDPKGLYKKARAGQLKNFTGIDSAYEPPEQAEVVLKGGEAAAEALVDQVLDALEQRTLV